VFGLRRIRYKDINTQTVAIFHQHVPAVAQFGRPLPLRMSLASGSVVL
jgi:hypothetical protein